MFCYSRGSLSGYPSEYFFFSNLFSSDHIRYDIDMKKKGGVTCFSWHLVEIPFRSMPTSPMDLDSDMRTTQILTFIESCQQFSNIEIVKMTFFCRQFICCWSINSATQSVLEISSRSWLNYKKGQKNRGISSSMSVAAK
jgi:hypothetical protein